MLLYQKHAARHCPEFAIVLLVNRKSKEIRRQQRYIIEAEAKIVN